VQILVTNDDGVRAPGIAALAAKVAQAGHEVLVVAPLVDYSGAGAAVGPVHSRDGVDYQSHVIEGLGDVPTYGIDGPPALAVILACLGSFGPRPEIVMSGINHGVNVGRSAMHSGTVGAALTGAHFGLRSLAVSIKWGDDPVPWSSPARLAVAMIPVLAAAPPRTTLNLNVPDVELDALRGLRHGRLGSGGAIRSAVHDTGTGVLPHGTRPPFPSGTLRLDLTPLGSSLDVGPDTDAGLVAHGFASLTPLVGVREAGDEAKATMVGAMDALYRLVGVGPGCDIAEEVEETEEDLAMG
jgi:5'-nucleotidase